MQLTKGPLTIEMHLNDFVVLMEQTRLAELIQAVADLHFTTNVLLDLGAGDIQFKVRNKKPGRYEQQIAEIWRTFGAKTKEVR